MGGSLKRSPLALPALLAVTILWGCTFIWMKQSLDAAAALLGRAGGATVVSLYIGVRFVLAAVLLALWPRARAGLDRGAWRGGAVLGALLFAGFLVQMLGLEGVTPPVSAFLTSLYVAFAAILTAWLRRSRPRAPLLAGVVLATLGAGFIEGPPHLTFGAAEWLTVGSALVFAVHILATDAITKAHAPLSVTLAMFVATAALAVVAFPVAALLTGTEAGPLAALLRDASFVKPLLLATLFATVLALTLMNQYQRELDPVRAAILFSLEPVWTTLIAAAMGLGRPGAWLWAGGGALIAGNLIAEWGALRPAPDPSR
ncbi:MAG TPA: DMT family transporter [Candidatus Polarisedimenticolaceae bacterium]|nr:DMT family transporter [Candidatus Polarisedimenticolaceae bacterium]